MRNGPSRFGVRQVFTRLFGGAHIGEMAGLAPRPQEALESKMSNRSRRHVDMSLFEEGPHAICYINDMYRLFCYFDTTGRMPAVLQMIEVDIQGKSCILHLDSRRSDTLDAVVA
jgi:hypothetical protein